MEGFAHAPYVTSIAVSPASAVKRDLLGLLPMLLLEDYN
jgi:hypothetical protein